MSITKLAPMQLGESPTSPTEHTSGSLQRPQANTLGWTPAVPSSFEEAVKYRASHGSNSPSHSANLPASVIIGSSIPRDAVSVAPTGIQTTQTVPGPRFTTPLSDCDPSSDDDPDEDDHDDKMEGIEPKQSRRPYPVIESERYILKRFPNLAPRYEEVQPGVFQCEYRGFGSDYLTAKWFSSSHPDWLAPQRCERTFYGMTHFEGHWREHSICEQTLLSNKSESSPPIDLEARNNQRNGIGLISSSAEASEVQKWNWYQKGCSL